MVIFGIFIILILLIAFGITIVIAGIIDDNIPMIIFGPLVSFLMIITFYMSFQLYTTGHYRGPKVEDVSSGEAHIDTLYTIQNNDTIKVEYQFKWNK